MSAPLVVSIGTTHPRNLAGLGLDARIAAGYGVRHAMVVAGVSAQDERGVLDLFAVPPTVVREQLLALRECEIAAIRIGALASTHNVRAVGTFLCEQVARPPIVFDPVVRASAGGMLYLDDPFEAFHDAFSANSEVIVTPNIDEAAALTGAPVADVEDMIEAGKRLVELGMHAALVTGGHLSGDPTDVLVSIAGTETFSDTRLGGTARGTGCTLAMALACELALGRELRVAVEGARACVRANIARE